MSQVVRGSLKALGVLLALAACKDGTTPTAAARSPAGDPMLTMGSGSSSSLLARATFSDTNNQTFDIKRITGDWQMQIKSKPAFDIAVQDIVFQPGGQSGWHSHPGPVFILVVKGTMTFYQADDPTCSPIVRTAGEGYLDLGEHPHIAVNETTAPAENIVTYFAPPHAALKIDEDKPSQCN